MTEPSDSTEAAIAEAVPMRDVLSRVGHELAHLARLLDQLQDVLGPLALDAAGRDPDVLHHMQSFDHIGQKVAGLADFLAALAPAAPCECLVDPAKAAQVVLLADLAARLGFRDEAGRSCATAWGDCELF